MLDAATAENAAEAGRVAADAASEALRAVLTVSELPTHIKLNLIDLTVKTKVKSKSKCHFTRPLETRCIRMNI